MAIKKQEFYEGAAIHILARTGRVARISYEPPLFYFNDSVPVLIKYSTRNRSPWSFTLLPPEAEVLTRISAAAMPFLALVCGSDGIAAFSYETLCGIARGLRSTAVHIACFRDHGEQYEVSGPDGSISHKVSPSAWKRLLDSGEPNETP